MELGALLCYNMATFMPGQGCALHDVPNATVFNRHAPSKSNTDQWCAAIAAFGAKYATIVVKHECGFLLWPSQSRAGGFRYEYGVPDGKDLIEQFAESCAGVGVRLGIYYSVVANSCWGYACHRNDLV